MDEETSPTDAPTESTEEAGADHEADSSSPGSGTTVETSHAESTEDDSFSWGETESESASSDPAGDVLEVASPTEAAALKRARAVSQLLDEAFTVPGTGYRVGLDPVLGILPVAGDSVATALSFYPIVEAYRLGAPNKMLLKMLALVGIDATVGSIPVLGTVFDAFWKANKWNIEMLERHIMRG